MSKFINYRPPSQPLFVSGDLDGFFGLAIDNLIQFILILGLCTSILGFSHSLILETIIPGAAISILIGNLFYAWQSQNLSRESGRTDVTALPYGINTVSLFAYIFLVMLPVKLGAQNSGLTPDQASTLAWQIGLAACFFSGIMEFVGAFFAEQIRKYTPRSALLSTLAGIAISFIAIDFAIKTFENPILSMLPLGIILTTYFSHLKMPLRIPGGLWAIIIGSIIAWALYFLGEKSPVSGISLKQSVSTVGFYFPIPVFKDIFLGLSHPLTYKYLIPVMIPMGLFNILGSLQNIESAEASGDSYKTLPSLAVNGIGTIAGHPLDLVFQRPSILDIQVGKALAPDLVILF